MKFVCNAEELAQACSVVQRAASAKTSIPSVEGILLSAEGKSLTLTGYDLEMGIVTEIPCAVEESGKIVVNAHMFSETVRKLPNKAVIVDSDLRNIASIECGDFNTTIVGMSAEDYPELPSITGGYDVTLSQPVLKDMIRKTIFSVAIKDARTVHTGVRFEIEKDHLRLVAVDGIRLAIRNEIIDYKGNDLIFVVPAKTLSEVSKLLSDEDDDKVEISVGKRHIIFKIGNYDIISRLLDGEFLNYKNAINTVVKTTVKVKTSELLESIERTSLIILDRLKCPLKCVFSNGYIKMSSNASIGASSDRIEAEIDGEDLIIGFNNKYLIDALRVCDTDEIKILLGSPISPIIIVPNEGDSFKFLILPVRLKNED